MNDGCAAEFDIDVAGGGGGYYPGPRPPYPGPGQRPPYGENVPNWAEGRWRATSGNSRLTILNNGRVTLSTGRNATNGYWSGDTLILDNGQRLRVERDRRDRIRVSWPGGAATTFRK